MAVTNNHLAGETSPYLLQHVDNPVDWYPWGDPAFEKARRENRPILLSIGYSTCHWCHVMAHECFEDEDVASLLNRDFVAIKVDREERPDIDQVYMDACQRMTGQGGWPLTILMTPDALPFYAATYLPKHGGYGRPGLMELLPLVAEKWQSEPERLQRTGQQVTAAISEAAAPAANLRFETGIFMQAALQLRDSFDERHAGFGSAPKFPRPHDLAFLLHRYQLTGDSSLRNMVEQTLVAMRCGGLYDHLGYGFHRYATDAAWRVPHFEKMLYDQAGLLAVYAEAFQVTGNPLYARTAREIITYLKRDMRSPQGGFYSAEDADTEGVEGRYYVWTTDELRRILGEEQARRFGQVYNAVAEGNFHDEASGMPTGTNILFLTGTEALSRADELEEAREQLLAARQDRPRPHCDDKIVTAWNGMLVSALAKAASSLQESSLAEDAERIVAFILSHLTDSNGRLMRCCRQDTAKVSAFAEDYAFLACGLLDLYTVTFKAETLLKAIDLAEQLGHLFQDAQSGVLFDTAHDADPLLTRPRTSWDGAMPAAGSTALDVFARLFRLTGDPRWRTRAERLRDSFSAQAAHYPAGFCRLLKAASLLMEPTGELVVAGHRDDATRSLLETARSAGLPNLSILFRPEPLPEALADAIPFLTSMSTHEGGPQAYLCRDFACGQACRDPDALRRILAELATH